MKKIRIGTRGSKLALWQAHHVARLIKGVYPACECEIIVIKTSGDLINNQPLTHLGGKGLFVREIEEALLSQKIDIAVHSVKDLPYQLPQGLFLACILERENPFDVFIAQKGLTLNTLPAQARVGSASPRRICQLKLARDDLNYVLLRGNVDTRIQKLKAGHYEAIILAKAALKRMGYENLAYEELKIIPCAGQGAIGIEAKEPPFKKFLKPINHLKTFEEVGLEREFLKSVKATCQSPLGCFVEKKKDQFNLSLFLSDLENKNVFCENYDLPLEGALREVQGIAMQILKNQWVQDLFGARD